MPPPLIIALTASLLALPAARAQEVAVPRDTLTPEAPSEYVTPGAPEAPGMPEAPSMRAEAETVVVRSSAAEVDVHSPQMGRERLPAAQARLLPALFGEVDVLRAIQLKTGVPSGSEGATGLYVRGGSSAENLVLFDGAPIYNPTHLFGFFGTFNADALDAVTLYKGGFPARYGGRLSSVLDVDVRDGRRDRVGVRGGVGLLAARLTAEGPLRLTKGDGDADADERADGSWIVSGRRTFVDVFTRAVRGDRTAERGPGIPDYAFSDVSARASYRLSPRDRVSVSAFHSADAFRQETANVDLDLTWGNLAGAARWRRLLTDELSVTTSVTGSRYVYQWDNRVPGYGLSLGSTIETAGARAEALFVGLDGHEIRLGAEASRSRYRIGRLNAGSDDGEVSFERDLERLGIEAGAYLSDVFAVGPRTTVSAGLRLSGFAAREASYPGVEPRLQANYRLTEDIGLKFNYARMSQYVHLVPTAGLAVPTDVWYPSTREVRPQRSDQVGIGARWRLAPGLTLESEAYAKYLTGLVGFVDGAQLFANNDLERELDRGRGSSYGLEVQLRRQRGRLRGWVAYTLQRTRHRGFARIMDGRAFSPRHDRRHDISVVGFYELSPRWRLSATWVYGSGDRYWLPVGRAFVQGSPGANATAVTPIYGDRNNHRLAAFHRLDLGAIYRLRPKWGESELSFGAFNAYDRRNAFFVYLDASTETRAAPDGGDYEIPTAITPRQVSLFPILPSVTWNFKL